MDLKNGVMPLEHLESIRTGEAPSLQTVGIVPASATSDDTTVITPSKLTEGLDERSQALLRL
jgi:hypothetical protein